MSFFGRYLMTKQAHSKKDKKGLKEVLYDCLNSIMVHTKIGGYNGLEN